ncbi:putative EG45-like domain containing protein 1 isoform X2 [Cynara cardunculus var. scolymus]|nr:putative EG45-like domain containing protein 1 isoform X2 [Cynara cardunculus var. scolymus]XP_024960244.1 putative EG45-like domain containing protein 1 isoform X2 [Cynara cardunculus var. scolymus]XP_024960245.1 putative EG45-like domain containing protein 1 isoform X2 [Cynara cardunculus var. scolymus]
MKQTQSVIVIYMSFLTSFFYKTLATASACYGNTPQGVMIAAASDPLWNNGAVCGKTFSVKCIGATNPFPHPCIDRKTITVKIVDHCPGCGGNLDLSKEAFALIANPVAGIIKIDYQEL